MVISVRVKICGITCTEDAQVAALAGADALGFVFVASSPRAISAEQAARIIQTLPPFVTTVGLFVDPAPEAVRGVLEIAALDVLQFHGNEDAALCASFGRPYLKAVPVRGPLDLDELQSRYADAQALLLDAWAHGQSGGTGVAFDWSLWPRAATMPLVLAGGLTPENVGEAIRATRPHAVDVSGGVEGSQPGRKNAARVRGFISEVRRVERVV
jgi:phosphoribosylanthranilate isomerase